MRGSSLGFWSRIETGLGIGTTASHSVTPASATYRPRFTPLTDFDGNTLVDTYCPLDPDFRAFRSNKKPM